MFVVREQSGKYPGDIGDVQPGSQGTALGPHVGHRQAGPHAGLQYDAAQDDAAERPALHGTVRSHQCLCHQGFLFLS